MKCLLYRAYLVCDTDGDGPAGSGRVRDVQWPHVGLDAFQLLLVEVEISGGVGSRNIRMVVAVEVISVAAPVVQVIIVEYC